MYSFAQTNNNQSTAKVYFLPTSPNPVALAAAVELKEGDIIRLEHLQKSGTSCLAYNPITGPFSNESDLVGRVVKKAVPSGKVITDEYLAPLTAAQMDTRLRNFWRKCR